MGVGGCVFVCMYTYILQDHFPKNITIKYIILNTCVFSNCNIWQTKSIANKINLKAHCNL